MRAPRLLLALEDHDRPELRHPGRVAGPRPPLGFDQLLGGGDRTCGLAGQDQPPHRAAGQVDPQRLGFLGHAQGIGGRRAHHRRPHVHDLPDPLVGGHGPTGEGEAPHLLAGVVEAPEPDERRIAERHEHRVGGPDAESPQAVAPHLGDPLPVLHAVEHTDGRLAGGAGGHVVADCRVLRSGDVGAVRGLLDLTLHPLVSGHQRDTPEVVEAVDRVSRDTGVSESLGLPGNLGVGPLHEVAELSDLEGLDLLARHGLVARVPVRRLGHSFLPFGVRGPSTRGIRHP